MVQYRRMVRAFIIIFVNLTHRRSRARLLNPWVTCSATSHYGDANCAS
jgi:hypothetical protein